ncbi:MarR family winged helix-turn-helix transcriptional regulator [Saccharothrix sp. ST-888]|uniref:MarR family winged helix-turn-helix transcriptional regulator n=1 Tax=Saccharothrix sp. ST-888 TaxID=1427391 RepID=UPI001E573CE8|nr:MarR family winged helix-turn-helix transcriptional regulator [Saccharothrix sp. ST-888]
MSENETPPSLTALTTYLLSKVGKSARTRLAERLADHGVRLWHMAVLAALADFGPHAQRDLAARLGIDPSDVVKVIDELARAGQVERNRDTADRRRVSVTLTPAGRAALTALTAEATAVQDAVLAPLTEQERVQLHTLLTRIHRGG